MRINVIGPFDGTEERRTSSRETFEAILGQPNKKNKRSNFCQTGEG